MKKLVITLGIVGLGLLSHTFAATAVDFSATISALNNLEDSLMTPPVIETQTRIDQTIAQDTNTDIDPLFNDVLSALDGLNQAIITDQQHAAALDSTVDTTNIETTILKGKPLPDRVIVSRPLSEVVKTTNIDIGALFNDALAQLNTLSESVVTDQQHAAALDATPLDLQEFAPIQNTYETMPGSGLPTININTPEAFLIMLSKQYTNLNTRLQNIENPATTNNTDKPLVNMQNVFTDFLPKLKENNLSFYNAFISEFSTMLNKYDEAYKNNNTNTLQ